MNQIDFTKVIMNDVCLLDYEGEVSEKDKAFGRGEASTTSGIKFRGTWFNGV